MTTRILIWAALACLLSLTACDQGGSEDTGDAAASANTSSVASTPPALDAEAPTDSAATLAEAEPTSIVLADGTQIKVIEASVLSADPKSYAGLVAISGEVAEVIEDKGTFMLKDCAQDAGCAPGDSCCSPAQVPVRLTLEDYEGSLPAVKQEVLVIAEVSPTEAGGFTLAVREVRQGDTAILTKKV